MPFLALFGVALADDTLSEPSVIIDEYVAASIAQQGRMEGASMEVEIHAELPKLHKSGRLRALRRISSLGRITYDALRFEGDRSVKNDVIARYLTAEAEALKAGPSDLSVTPANYKFKYKGLFEKEGRKVYTFHVNPRKKRIGLFEGELWVDRETHLAVRESGRMVKSPSVFVKRIDFVREYEIQGGLAVPRRIESLVETRLIGKARLSVAFTSFSLPQQARAVATGGL